MTARGTPLARGGTNTLQVSRDHAVDDPRHGRHKTAKSPVTKQGWEQWLKAAIFLVV